MPEDKQHQQDTTIGYFTVVEDDRNGWTGGLLVLDRSGRPLEFQCTLPVRPSRAHEILFGPTLQSHLVGEVIGKLLIEKCRTPLSIVCCDQIEGLATQAFSNCPVALLIESSGEQRVPVADETLAETECIQIAGASLIVPMERRDQAESLADHMNDLPDAIEPFERIREAIKEAHSQLSRSNSDAA